VQGLSWYWIALELTVTPLIALAVTLPFWRKGEMIFGNIVGSAVIFASAIGLILREYVEVDRVVQECLSAGTTCWPEPSAFARFAIYASIGLAEVFLLFTVSLAVERRIRNRDYAVEWRR
jgi:hypothetical protein